MLFDIFRRRRVEERLLADSSSLFPGSLGCGVGGLAPATDWRHMWRQVQCCSLALQFVAVTQFVVASNLRGSAISAVMNRL